ncbi:hypothetical protein OZX62_00975 [Bifidobacterium sp. ESL0690]|uniref:glycoside hydrolase family 65 protein n=1 Tax=Bifidobacterium sp. ESL0690 TaxID=2983214 RepID=UPI0023F8B4CA|nr:glycosyl hydrolase family 65 protein [Bifidobacterium sp. ESL0690]WEV46904.1 hypothetical protein OZX62_00975 [Bifidobacterium sp. ESL0690]
MLDSNEIRQLDLQDDPLDAERYPIDPWKFTEYGKPTAESATLFSLSNGTIGVRGEASAPRNLGAGTFLSGFHETFAIRHAEEAYGFARVGQVVQGVPDTVDFRFSVNGKQLTDPQQVCQSLDFKEGTATRSYTYEVGDGASLEVSIVTMVCLFRADLMATTLTFRAHGRAMNVHVEGKMNTDHPVVSRDVDPRKADLIADGGLRKLEVDAISRGVADESFGAFHCLHSGLTMGVGFCQQVDGEMIPDVFDVKVPDGGEKQVLRYAAYNTYRINPIGVDKGLEVSTIGTQNSAELIRLCAETLNWAVAQGLERLQDQQRAWLERFWQESDVAIDDGGDGRLQQTMHWELFELAQATATVANGVSAKGLSGTGYSGHYFWDTETYIVPFLIYTNPARARDILSYRFRMLPAARKRARMMSVEGALFPWRGINGEEASAFFEAGTAQCHIDADIAYAVNQYVSVTGDHEFLATEGIDILVETARMWASLGYMGWDGTFHINTVTGPDEYTALVDDNYYTNVMAQFNLRKAADALESLDGEELNAVVQRLGVKPGESMHWREVAELMKLPYDKKLGVHLQDDDILRREPWDFEHDTQRPLLLHYHPIVIYRRRVLKQTDTVLALYLLSSNFGLDVKRRDFDFYDPLTTGDSSLSAASQCILAAEVGYGDLAMQYFLESLYADVANLHSNTSDGIHLASAGGVWMSVVAGFGGLRDSGGEELSIDPHLPNEWESLTYRLTIHGSRLVITVTHGDVTVRRVSGDPVTLQVKGELRTV